MEEFNREVTNNAAEQQEEMSEENYVSDYEAIYEIIDSVVAQANLSPRRKHIISLGVRVAGELLAELIAQRAENTQIEDAYYNDEENQQQPAGQQA